MGQYQNQPDFASVVDTVLALPATGIKSAAIYIGTCDANATITVLPVGNTSPVTFTGISSGSFLPVIVSQITAAVGILPENILLIK